MSTRLQISALIYMMVQAVIFGACIIIVMATPLQKFAMSLIPIIVIVSALVSFPVSWALAPRLRARFWRQRQLAKYQ